MITEGLLYTVIGMGMVFAFLTVLVFMMDGLGWFVGILDKHFPENKPGHHAPKTHAADNAAVAVAIAAAKHFGK